MRTMETSPSYRETRWSQLKDDQADLFLIGVDGGGSGTRVVLGDAQRPRTGAGGERPVGPWASASSAPGRPSEAALRRRVRRVPASPLDWARCVTRLRAWRGSIIATGSPRFGRRRRRWPGLPWRATPTRRLLGAHGGAHGVIVALGTGSIAAALDGDGECRIASGFGFPSGDEASGAWLGLRPSYTRSRRSTAVCPLTLWRRRCSPRPARRTATAWSSGCAQPIRPPTQASRRSSRASHASVRGASARRGGRESAR